MNEILLIVAVIAIGLGGMFSFIYLLDQKSKAQARTGKPSRLIRLSALVMGLAGIGASLWLEVGSPWFILPLSLVLLAYGFFGLFGTVRPPPK
jgi:hypothetical protein